MGVRINKISKVLGTFTGTSGDPILTSNVSTGKVDTAANSFGVLPNGRIWIGDPTNAPVPQLISGDLTISNTGVAAIGAGVIVNADINAAAAIALTKLAPLGFSLALVSDGSGFITTSLTTATQIGFLSTTTSDVQVQINAKQGVITGAASSVVTTNLNPNIVAVTDGAGKFTSATTTVTALSYVNNLTSDAQAQINTKLTANPGAAVLGDLLYYNGSNWTRFAIGTNGQVLTTTGGSIGWGSATANGLPVGGSAAQFLAKNSGINYDASWFTLSVSLITDILATAAQINASTTYLTVGGVPTGTNGQALTISGGVMGWTNVGTGTVTSVGVTGGTTGLTFSGSPVTTSGTMVMSGTLATVNGGTNQTAVAIGDILYGSGVNTWSRLAATTNGFVLTLAGGVPTWAATGAGSFWVTNGATALSANTSQTGNFTNQFSLNGVNIIQNSQGAGAVAAFVVNGGAHTAVATVSNYLDIGFNTINRTVQFATGAVATKSITLFGGGVTYSFVGASVVTEASTILVNGTPLAGANATITNTSGILIASTATVATNSYGITVNAQTGATNNYAARFIGGNVGIGTSAPDHRLHVSDTSAIGTGIRIENLGAGSPELLLSRTGGTAGAWGMYMPSGTADLRFSGGGFLDRVTFLASGNVGIGTTSPTAKFEITHPETGAASVAFRISNISTGQVEANFIRTGGTPNSWSLYLPTSSTDFRFNNGGVDRLTLLANGNVGIGTASPGVPLDVVGTIRSINGGITISNSGAAGNYTLVTSIGSWQMGADNNGNGTSNSQWYLYDALTGSYRITVQRGTGNVGVGTVSPAELLHLTSASATGTAIRLDNTGGGRQWRIRSNNIGEFSVIDQTAVANRFNIRTDGSIEFPQLQGTGTTTATLNASGILGRTSAIAIDLSNNILLDSSVYLNNNLFVNSDVFFTNGVNIFTGLISGTMIGTSVLQKLSFYGQIPDGQPDTGIVSIPKLTFGGSPIGENDTIGGYTMGQVVAALKQLGLLN